MKDGTLKTRAKCGFNDEKNFTSKEIMLVQVQRRKYLIVKETANENKIETIVPKVII